MKRDLIEFASIYVIVFWLVIAGDPIASEIKLALFAICFVMMGSAYCALKAILRAARPNTSGN